MSRHLLKQESGTSLGGYALMVGLVAVTAIFAVGQLGDGVGTLFQQSSDSMSGATPAGSGSGGNGNGNEGSGEEEGGGEGGEEPGPADHAPDAFAFANQDDVATGGTISSDAVQLLNFDGPQTASCGAGCTGISRNGGGFQASPVSGFMDGDTIAIQQIASSSFGTTTTASVTVGDTTSEDWSVTTIGQDTTPDAFFFSDQSDAEPGDPVDSDNVQLLNFDGPLTASCGAGCTGISRNGGGFQASPVAGFMDGDTIAIRQTASSSFDTPTTASVTVGDTASADWTVTTRSPDTAPDAFSFSDQGGAALGATVPSNNVQLLNFEGSLTATCDAGCTGISRNGGGFQASPVSGFVDGDTIAIRQTASSGYGAPTTASVTVGDTASADWTVTTIAAPGPFTFTTCGASGRTGPNQSACTSAYSSTALAGLVTVTNGIQSFSLPGSGVWRIQATGSRGGNGQDTTPTTGGKGSLMRGEFTLAGGTGLKILVGQHGQDNANHDASNTGCDAGGGGASWVVLSDNTPLVIAGAGGGATQNSNNGSSGSNASTARSGTQGPASCTTTLYSGGSGGAGGSAFSDSTNGTSAGGGGLSSDGQTGRYSVPGGKSFLNGGAGGDASLNSLGRTSAFANGGFGGGGAGIGNCNLGGGAGGGYSGGGGSRYCGGGGGGSFINDSGDTGPDGANPFTQSAAGTSDGQVVITYVGP
jgi:Flp pilus assembly pilin Flp